MDSLVAPRQFVPNGMRKNGRNVYWN